MALTKFERAMARQHTHASDQIVTLADPPTMSVLRHAMHKIQHMHTSDQVISVGSLTAKQRANFNPHIHTTDQVVS
jgi:hypothetical protein